MAMQAEGEVTACLLSDRGQPEPPQLSTRSRRCEDGQSVGRQLSSIGAC